MLEEQRGADETGLFLCTAHPAKFKEVVDSILGSDIELPAPLAKHAAMDLLSLNFDADFAQLRELLVKISG